MTNPPKSFILLIKSKTRTTCEVLILSKKNHVKKFYNDYYSDASKHHKGVYLYRKLKKFEVNRNKACLRGIKQFLEKKNREIYSILEIGTGEGVFLEMISRELDSIDTFYGFDISSFQLEKARIRLQKKMPNKNLNLIQYDCNVEPWPMETNSIDLIVCIAVLEHLFDPHLFINECYRILKPGCLVVIEVPNIAFIPNRIRLMLGRLPITSRATGWDGGHLHYFTKKSLVQAFISNNFKKGFITISGIFSSIRKIWKSLLGADLILGFTAEK